MLLLRPEEMSQMPENYREKLYLFCSVIVLFLHKLNLT